MTWMLTDNSSKSGPVRLRERIARGDSITVPGVFNPLTAKLAEKTGFEATYFSGAAFSAGLGIPDIGLFSLDELAHAVRWMVRASEVPLIVDADTGFGEALNVVRTVKELEDVGSAAIQIEDQVLPKRCGHLEGKTVITADAFAEKIAAASRAREDMLIIARTDVRALEGMDAAIERGLMCRDAGADIIFPEAMQTEEEFARYADAVGGPLLANMTEFGKSPYLTVESFAELGYQIVIFPVTALRVAMKAVEGIFSELQENGTQVDWLGRMQTRSELYDLIEYEGYQAIDSELAFSKVLD